MTFTFLILIALIGAALLGFASAWFSQQRAVDAMAREKSETDKKLLESKTTITKLETEAKGQKLTIENLQKQNQTVEIEVIKLQTELRVLEGEVKVLQREKRNLLIENSHLTEELKNNINEIEVIREIPVYKTENGQVTDEEALDLEKRIENAKRLVNAFKKGVSENSNSPVE